MHTTGTMRIKGALGVAAAALLLLAGCLPATTVEATDPPPGADVVITISNHSYDVSGAVPAGGTVAIVNHDSVDHTVTADDGVSFDVYAPAGQTVTFTAPVDAGTFSFHCIPHPSMVDDLIVG